MKQIITVLITLIPVFIFSQNKYIATSPATIDKWLHATINIEVRNRDQIASGTAIWLKVNNRDYLLTARHLLHDPFSADTNKITDRLILIENYTERDIADRWDSSRQTMTFVGDYHFLILNTKPQNRPLYLFSSVKEDLAIIYLNYEITGQSFASTLYHRGYRPIFLSDIDTTFHVQYGDRILAIGYPQESEVSRKKPSPMHDFISTSISIPIISEGITTGIFDSVYFQAFISIYHGFSGGPIIRNNKLIGIVHGLNLPLSTTNSIQLPLYSPLELNLIRTDLIMPFLRRFEYEHY